MRRTPQSAHCWYCTDRPRAASLALVVTLALHLMIGVPLLLHPGNSLRQSSSKNSPLVFAGLLAPEATAGRPQSEPRWVSATAPSEAAINGVIFTPVEFAEEVPVTVGPVPDFIRRMGIITARIQGAWSLPGGPRDRDFHCSVRLHEDDAGVLREVELWQCDDDPELQASLLKAIRASTRGSRTFRAESCGFSAASHQC